MHKPVAAVTKAFALSAHYFQRPIIDDVARMYAADVADLPTAAVLRALEELRREPKRRTLPLPAEVRAYILKHTQGAGPEIAEQVAARITGAISRYGYNNASQARTYMGDVGWEACEELGGYVSLCQRLRADEMGTFFAQSRELCRAILERGPVVQAQRTALPEATQKRLGGLVERVLGGVGGGHDVRQLPPQHAIAGSH